MILVHILTLLDRLQRDKSLTYIFVSHDLSVVRQISDTVSVLKNGHVVESGTFEEIFTYPKRAYTRDLISAIPGKANALHHSLLGAQL